MFNTFIKRRVLSFLPFGVYLMGGLFFVTAFYFVAPAHADPGEGTAVISVGTGGDHAENAMYSPAGNEGAVIVGGKSFLRLDLTVGASGIAPSQNNTRFKINENLFPAQGWKPAPEAALADLDAVGEWFVAYTDTDPNTTDNTNIDFSSSTASDVGVVSLQSNQQMDSSDIVTLYGVVQDDHYALAAAPLSISTDDTGADDWADLMTLPTIATQPYDANATLTLGENAVVGKAGETTLNLSTPFALQAGDTIEITFPPQLDVSAMGADVTGDFENGHEMTCAAAAQVVTCTVSGETLITGNIIFSGITSKNTGTDDATLNVRKGGMENQTLAMDLLVTTTDSVAVLDVPAQQDVPEKEAKKGGGGGGGGGYKKETYCAVFGLNCPEDEDEESETKKTSSSDECDLDEKDLLDEGMNQREINTLKYLNNKLEEIGEGCITGYGEPNTEGKVYDWDGPLQRDHMAKIMSITLGTGTSSDYSNLRQFSDINLSQNPWYARYLAPLMPTYYRGYQPKNAKPYFAPAEPLKNMHLGALVLRSFDIEPAQPRDGSPWYTNSHAKALQLDLLSGSPNKLVTRGETFEAYAKLFALVDDGAINGDSDNFDFEAFVKDALATPIKER